MKLESIELENIRSYQKGFLSFPEGSVLLSGDIGSGKSTLLLATEFALFGIRRGELDGGSLLRRGKKSGLVKLTFSIDNQEVVIERTLKRTGSSVTQDSGKIIVNGVGYDCTPTELKARILQHLGYPQDLLDKQKSLLYRYTVYTPQEKLKSIMWAKPDERLDSLRKVFGVERYKLIQENLDLFLRSLRAKKRELGGIHKDLDAKLGAKSELGKVLAKAKRQIQSLTEKRDRIKGEFKEWQEKKKNIEEQSRLYIEYDKELVRVKAERKTTEGQLETATSSTTSLKKLLQEIDELKSPTDMSEEELGNQIKSLSDRIDRCLTEPQGASETIDGLLKKIKDAKETLEKGKERRTQIDTMMKNLESNKKELKAAGDICPICRQKLDEGHRRKKILEYDTEINTLKEEHGLLETEISTLTTEDKNLGKKLKEEQDKLVRTLRVERVALEQLKTDLEEYNRGIGTRGQLAKDVETAEQSEETLTGKLEEIETTIHELEKKLKKLADVAEKKSQIEEELERVQGESTGVETNLASANTEKKLYTNQIKEINKEIKHKKNARKFEDKLKSFENWLGEYLINLASTIEKHYMIELKRKFDPMFSDWFNLLVEDEQLSVRIDDEFTPVIEQEGYEAEYENLSGGEGASVALAYRLALNKVINTMVEEIKTKDLIILDEPTDGFSNDQIDKIRDVVGELGAKQTIIVSHEPKIESYVDNIIRIRKEDGLSRIN